MTPQERAAAIASWKREIRRAQEMLLSPNPETLLAGEVIISRANGALRALDVGPRVAIRPVTINRRDPSTPDDTEGIA
jgi:hypothetical protein